MKLLTEEELEDCPSDEPLVSLSYQGLDASDLLSTQNPNNELVEYFILTDSRDIGILELLKGCPDKQEVVVHNLSDQITSHVLYLAFVTFVPKQQRKELQADFILDEETKGHGLLRFPQRRSAELALICMQEFEICGDKIRIEWGENNSCCKENSNKYIQQHLLNKNGLRNEIFNKTCQCDQTKSKSLKHSVELPTPRTSSSLTYAVSGPASCGRSRTKTIQSPCRKNTTITVSSDNSTPNLPSSCANESCTSSSRTNLNTPATTIPSLLSICVPIMQAKSHLTSSNPLLGQCNFPMSLLPLTTPLLPTVSSIISSNPLLKTYSPAVVRPTHPLGLVSLATPAVITSLPVYSSPVVLRHIYQNSTNSYHGPRPTATPLTTSSATVLPHLMTVYSPVVVAPSLVQNMPSVVYQTALQFQQTQQLQLPAASWAVHASEVNQIEPHLSIVKVGRTISDTVFAETIKTDSSSDQMSRKRQAKSRWDQKIPWKKLKAVIRENKMANSINGDEQKHMSENHSQKPEQNLDESYSGTDGGESLTTLQEDVGSCTERDGESRQYEVMNHDERINDSVCESCGSLSCDGSHGVSDHNEQEGNGSCESCGSLSCEGFHGIQQYHNAQGGNKTFCRKCGSYGHLDEQEFKKDNVPESCKYCGYASAHDRTENEDAVLENSAGLTDLSQDNLLDEVKVNNNDSEEKNVLLTASKDAEPLNSRKARKILCWLTAEQKVHLLKAVCVRLRDAGVSGCLGVTELYTETET